MNKDTALKEDLNQELKQEIIDIDKLQSKLSKIKTSEENKSGFLNTVKILGYKNISFNFIYVNSTLIGKQIQINVSKECDSYILFIDNSGLGCCFYKTIITKDIYSNVQEEVIQRIIFKQEYDDCLEIIGDFLELVEKK